MNAGLSNLDSLKKRLLASSTQGDTGFDLAIQGIGLGMAGRVETFLNRKLARVVGWQEILPADRINFLLSRFPVETMTTIELKPTEADGWILQDATFYQSLDLQSGMVICPEDIDPGEYYSQVRFTYTGGFWWEPAEPGDAVYPTAQPAGSNLLPDDIRTAWLMMCQQVWDSTDVLGLGLVSEPGKETDLQEIKMSALVREMLRPYVRNQMV